MLKAHQRVKKSLNLWHDRCGQPFSAIEQLVAQLIAVECRGTDYGFRVQEIIVNKQRLIVKCQDIDNPSLTVKSARTSMTL